MWQITEPKQDLAILIRGYSHSNNLIMSYKKRLDDSSNTPHGGSNNS